MNGGFIYTYKATVLRVVDGDTIDVVLDLGFNISLKERLRLAGIDTPETRGKSKKAGLKAKQYVIDKIEGKEIEITTEKKGKYGRYLATIWYWIDEYSLINLNADLVEKKLAKFYSGGKR